MEYLQYTVLLSTSRIVISCTPTFCCKYRNLSFGSRVHFNANLLPLSLVKTKFHYAIQLANQLANWFVSWSTTC